VRARSTSASAQPRSPSASNASVAGAPVSSPPSTGARYRLIAHQHDPPSRARRMQTLRSRQIHKLPDRPMVTCSAFQNAASIAKNILTTEAIVAEVPEKKAAGPVGNAGGHERDDVRTCSTAVRAAARVQPALAVDALVPIATIGGPVSCRAPALWPRRAQCRWAPRLSQGSKRHSGVCVRPGRSETTARIACLLGTGCVKVAALPATDLGERAGAGRHEVGGCLVKI
jgi:hypothetical protein